jgi:cell division protein ZapA
MPDVTVKIGDREFDVACQEGEEHYLRSAAAMLDAEAQSLVSQIRHLTEPRLLLMSGLMLADKTAGIDDNLKLAEKRIAELEARLGEAEARAGVAGDIAPAITVLSGLADRAEALAKAVEDKAAG